MGTLLREESIILNLDKVRILLFCKYITFGFLEKGLSV